MPGQLFEPPASRRVAPGHSTPGTAALIALIGLLLFGARYAPAAQPSAPPPGGPAPAPQPSAPPPGGPAPAPRMKALGGERYEIGRILVEKRAHRITVPGHVQHLGEAPLEYLAVTTRGLKAYETLLELDATGSEFNLALILIGCDSALSSHPGFQFDRSLPFGQVTDITVRWNAGGTAKSATAEQALLSDEQRQQMPPSEWIYTGSITPPHQTIFGADAAGTLIGFVHDPNDVIEHRAGLGIGRYGSVRGNTALMPAIGTPVEVVVTLTERVRKRGEP